MKLSAEPITLNLVTTFRVAHGASDQRYNVVARLEHTTLTGLGEAPGVAYHGESQAGILAYLGAVTDLLGDDPFLIDDILNRLLPGSRAGCAAVDIALHDLWGQIVGQPLYRLLGLSPQRIPETSFTIAIADPQIMAAAARRSSYPIYKIKVGGAQDEAVLAAIRKVTRARLRLDANAGWSREQALDLIRAWRSMKSSWLSSRCP